MTDILGNVSVTPITLPKEHLKAQFKLVKEVLNEELDVGIYFNTELMESPNMYEVRLRRTSEKLFLQLFSFSGYGHFCSCFK